MIRIPRVHHIQVKTHKLTIMLAGLSPSTKISELKEDTLSALTSGVAPGSLDIFAMEPPEFEVETVDDFELCRAVKERGRPTGAFEILQSSKSIKDCSLSGWEAIFLQFKDQSTGNLLPITYTLPSVYDDEEDPSRVSNAENGNKGKRKASPDTDEE